MTYKTPPPGSRTNKTLNRVHFTTLGNAFRELRIAKKLQQL